MSTIGPGTMLLCVNGEPVINDDPDSYPRSLVVGAVYECIGEGQHHGGTCLRDRCSSYGVMLADEMPYPWCRNRFRPAGRKGEFDALLNATDAPAESEQVDA